MSLDGFKYFAATAELQANNTKRWQSGRADISSFNVDDLLGAGLLVKEGGKLLINGIKSYGNSLAKESGWKNIDWIRRKHNVTTGKNAKRNVALMGGEIEGQPIFMAGMSGQTIREGLVGNPGLRMFTWRVIRHPRDFDTEIKLLEEFAARFHRTPNVKGRLGIISLAYL